MTVTPQTPLPAPATPDTPAWALYVYDERAFFTFEGRLIAQASVATPAQDARIEAVFHRLAHHTTQRSTRS